MWCKGRNVSHGGEIVAAAGVASEHRGRLPVRVQVIVVRATPKAYEELGRADVGIRTRQAPALAGGLLYLRDDENVLCIDVRK